MVVNLLERLDRRRFQAEVCCFDVTGRLAEGLVEQGIPVRLLRRRPGVDWRYIFTLARYLRANRADVLHMHNPTAFFYGTLAGKLARVPCLIYTEHGRDFSSSVKIKWANRVLSWLVDKVVTVADFGQRYLVNDERIPAGKVVTIHNGIDAAKFGGIYDRAAIRAALGLTADQAVIGIVARLDPIKNHAVLLAAMQQVIMSIPDAVLLVAGDGPLRTALETTASSLGLGSHVRFLGARSDIPELMCAMDLFVLCSYSEGLSLTLIEASAAGKAIVATDVGGNAEVVQQGVTGLLVPSDQPAVLAEAIQRLLSTPEELAAMGSEGRRHFEVGFTLDGMVAAYEALYRHCLR